MPNHTYKIVISDDDKNILDNDLLDVDAWIQQAVRGKINNCRKRMVRVQVAVLRADPTVATIPTDDTVLIAKILEHKNYKNRAARDEVARLARERDEVARLARERDEDSVGKPTTKE